MGVIASMMSIVTHNDSVLSQSMSIQAMNSLDGMDAPQYSSAVLVGSTSASVVKANICHRLCVYGLSQKKKNPAAIDIVMIDLQRLIATCS
tara:strand:- start:196 stop:468 length:273 start_codon:yes stop_codon:yes gene_type:complete